MIYGYMRCSTTEQRLDRQEDALETYCKENNIVIDKMFQDQVSGKNFDRKEYQEMRNAVQSNDIIIVKELDRFGRNMQLIKDEWNYYMKMGVRIIVIDMPLISSDLNNKKTLDMQFISNLVFEVLCYSAEKEREKISKRVKEGMKCAIERGAKVGAPVKFKGELLKKIKLEWDKGTKQVVMAEMFGITREHLCKIRKKYGWQPRKKERK